MNCKRESIIPVESTAYIIAAVNHRLTGYLQYSSRLFRLLDYNLQEKILSHICFVSYSCPPHPPYFSPGISVLLLGTTSDIITE